MSTPNSRRLATMALAVMLPLAFAPMAQANTVPLPYRHFAHNHESGDRNGVERVRTEGSTLERDIDTARADIDAMKFDDALHDAQVALALSATLAKAPPAPIDGTGEARMSDANSQIAMAVKLIQQNRPQEARELLQTAKLDVATFVTRPMS